MAMNIFRLTGDNIHLLAILILWHRLVWKKNAQGISRRTQELYMMVFATRYLDLFTFYYSTYNSFMKVVYLFTTGYFVFIMSSWSNHPVRTTYRGDQDNMDHWDGIALPCLVVSFLMCWISGIFQQNGLDAGAMELLWTFSILLESVACIPQIILFRRYRQVENVTGGSFIFLMALYRTLYGLNWIYRAHTEAHYRHHFLVYGCGAVQCVIGFVGLFWPTGEATAPVMPQLIRLFREVFCFGDTSDEQQHNEAARVQKTLSEPESNSDLLVV